MVVNPKRGLAHKKRALIFIKVRFFVVLYFWHAAWRRTIKEDLRFSVKNEVKEIKSGKLKGTE